MHRGRQPRLADHERRAARPLVLEEARGGQRGRPDGLLRHLQAARAQPRGEVAPRVDGVVGQDEERDPALAQRAEELGRARDRGLLVHEHAVHVHQPRLDAPVAHGQQPTRAKLPGAMSHVVVSNLAYAHPGGDLLFSDVSFKVGSGDHVGLVGANGVGKSTLLRILAGRLEALEGDADVGPYAYMPQDVGVGADERTVREMLLELAPPRLRAAGEKMLAAEHDLAAGGDAADAGMRLGEAIADWSEYGGYELEGQWDAACRRIVRSGFDDVGARRTTAAVRRRAQAARARGAVLRRRAGPAARRARQLPRRPGEARAGGADRGLEEDRPARLPRPRPARRGGDRDPHARGQRLLDARRLLPHVSRRRAPAGRSCSATGWSSGSARSAACSGSTRS